MDDAKLLFDWANEKSVRENSFSTDMILYDKHLTWLEQKLQSASCGIYIAIADNLPVGQVRIDMKQDQAVIDYSVDCKKRGKGYGAAILVEVEALLKREYPHIRKLAAQVKCNNKASLRVFEKLEYEESFVELLKKL